MREQYKGPVVEDMSLALLHIEQMMEFRTTFPISYIFISYFWTWNTGALSVEHTDWNLLSRGLYQTNGFPYFHEST